jgi:hypothetical protein
MNDASALVCECLGDHTASWKNQERLKRQRFNLFPIWRSKRYHELELSKMLWKASSVGLQCMIRPILQSVVSHSNFRRSGNGHLSSIDYLIQRLPLEFAGVELKGDEKKYKLGALGTAATYGWDQVVREMVLDFHACVPKHIFHSILTHVDSIFYTIMPILVQGVPCQCVLNHEMCQSSKHGMVTSMKDAIVLRKKELKKISSVHSQVPPVIAGDDGGGWNANQDVSNRSTKTHKCDIDSVFADDITSEVFLRDYVYNNKPIIIRGALLSNRFLKLRETFRKKKLYKILKGNTLHQSIIPYPTLFLRNQTETTLMQYFKKKHIEEPNYIFVPCPLKIQKHIRNHPPSRILKNSNLWKNQRLCEFYAGSKFTGSPPHWHVLALNFLMFGEKKWILGPPRASFHSRTTSFNFWKSNVLERKNSDTNDTSVSLMDDNFDSDASGKTYLYCSQHAGDLLLVPRFWTHSTINEQNTVGYALEFNVLPTFPTVKQPLK